MKIRSWDEAEAVMGKIAGIDLECGEARQLADLAIKQVKDKLKFELDGIGAGRDGLVGDLEDFARGNQADLAPLKSKRLRYGILGFRDEPKFIWPKKLDTLLTRLKELKLKAYIRVKEEPDKQGIMAHHEQLDLKALGVKRLVEPDVFFLTLDGEK